MQSSVLFLQNHIGLRRFQENCVRATVSRENCMAVSGELLPFTQFMRNSRSAVLFVENQMTLRKFRENRTCSALSREL